MNGSELAGLLPLVLIFALIYVVMIRPARARQREALRLQDSLVSGQQVMTTSGLYGTLVEVDGDTVVLETSPGVTSRWARPAVARVVDESADAVPEPGAASGRSAQPQNADSGGGLDGPSAGKGKQL